MSLRGQYRSTAAVAQTASFLMVRLGTIFCALPSQGVRGVLTRQEAGSGQTVTAVGITYYEVDLAGRLSSSLELEQSDVRTVLYSNGNTHGAIRVEEVIGMIEVEREQCRPLPPHFRQDERNWISGTTFFREHLALILNPEWVLGELGEEISVGAERVRPTAISQSALDGESC